MFITRTTSSHKIMVNKNNTNINTTLYIVFVKNFPQNFFTLHKL